MITFLTSGYGYHIGGIQVVAALANDGLQLYYDTQVINFSPVPHELQPNIVTLPTKKSILFHLLKNRIPAGPLFVNHIGLLKLLPFARYRGPVICFLHGVEVWKRFPWWHRNLFKRVDLFISNSQYTYDKFLKYNPEAKSIKHVLTELGIESQNHEPIVEPSPKPIVLCVSRLANDEDYKGHRQIINVWQEVLKVIPNAEFWIAGDGNLRSTLESQVQRLNVQDSVKFYGRVTEEKKHDMLNQCRCFAMPSQGEGFGLVYLEAMRVGRPCLVSNNLDAGNEVVNAPEAGLACNPDNPQELASSLIRLLTPGPEWNQWSKQARARYQSKYTVEKFQERFRNVIKLVAPLEIKKAK